jgi:hypothetical protein
VTVCSLASQATERCFDVGSGFTAFSSDTIGQAPAPGTVTQGEDGTTVSDPAGLTPVATASAGGLVTNTWNGSCVSGPDGTISRCLPLMRSRA